MKRLAARCGKVFTLRRVTNIQRAKMNIPAVLGRIGKHDNASEFSGILVRVVNFC